MDVRRRTQIGGIKKTPSGGSTTGGSYTVNLNSQWEKTTAVTNPDSSLYDGVYRSSSSYNVNSGVSIMYITLTGYSAFKLYIRSYAESNYDYVMVSQLDKTITGSSSYSDTTLVKAHTRGNQQSGTALSSYTLVKYTGISSGSHTITIVYRKDGSVNNGDDRGYVLIPKSQESEGPINTDNYLTIEALEDGLTASLSKNACEYCVDGDDNWKSLSAGTATESINSGHTLSFRGKLTPNDSNGIGTFAISKKCNLKGNCMSMLFGDNAANNYSLSGKSYAFYHLFDRCTNIVNVSSNFLPARILARYCYSYMFFSCTSLTTAPELPATTLARSCYSDMFDLCTNLTTAPELPATTLEDYCYFSMFERCYNLTTAPELPATTLADSCYYYMFSLCMRLTTAPELPARILASSCYMYMFEKCTRLTTAPELPATTLARNCYNSMFYSCERLTTAPELPVTRLEHGCYGKMFYGCKSLTTAPELPATTLADSCYNNMFSGTNILPDCSNIDFMSNTVVASGGLRGLFAGTKVTDNDLERILPKNSNGRYYLPVTILASYCYERMFEKCTRLTTAPELPATTLAFSCYNYMFSDCEKLTTAPELPATTLASYCYDNMFWNCDNLTTAPELPATTLAIYCYNNMFRSCSKLKYIKMLATDISASYCLSDWVSGVASTGTFVKNSAMTTLPTGNSGIPSGWTVQNA